MKRNQLKLWLRMKGKVQPKKKKKKTEKRTMDMNLSFVLQVSSFNSNRMEGKEMITTKNIVVVTTN